MWVVYIIYSKRHHRTYTGSTNDFRDRLHRHNTGQVESTAIYRPWIPIYIEFYPDELSARTRERHLKTSVGRRYLSKAIDQIINKWSGSSVG